MLDGLTTEGLSPRISVAYQGSRACGSTLHVVPPFPLSHSHSHSLETATVSYCCPCLFLFSVMSLTLFFFLNETILHFSFLPYPRHSILYACPHMYTQIMYV